MPEIICNTSPLQYDGMARQFAETLTLRLTGTLGLLIDAKHAGMLSTVTPSLIGFKHWAFGWRQPRVPPC